MTSGSVTSVITTTNSEATLSTASDGAVVTGIDEDKPGAAVMERGTVSVWKVMLGVMVAAGFLIG